MGGEGIEDVVFAFVKRWGVGIGFSIRVLFYFIFVLSSLSFHSSIRSSAHAHALLSSFHVRFLPCPAPPPFFF